MLLTIPEAASLAKVSARTIRRLILSGRLVASDFGNGTERHDWRIAPDALLRVAAPEFKNPALTQLVQRRRPTASPVDSIYPDVASARVGGK